MRVALVVPNTKSYLGINFPLNLGYISSYLKQACPSVDIKIFDGTIEDNVELSISKFQPEIVGVTATTPQAPAAYQLADNLANSRPDILTVIGGVHASALPEEAAMHFNVVVVGEGEKAFANIAQDFQKHGNKKLFPKIMQGEPEDNLDALPMPDYSLFDMKRYLSVDYSFVGLKGPTVMLITSRGCPYKCVFCHNSGSRSKVRYHSAKRIADEISFLHRNYGVTGVLFEDDEFLINTRRLNELNEIMSQQGMNKWFRWACSARATTLKVPLMTMIKDMGCIMVIVGFESGSEKSLAYLKCGSTKLADNERALEVSRTIKKPVLGGYFIIGTPFETLDEMKQTQKFIEKARLHFVNVNTLVPYPATQLWQDCKKLNLIPENVDYEKINNMAGIPTFSVATVPYEPYIKFLIDTQKINRAFSYMRNNPSLKVLLAKSPHGDFRYTWLHHPIKMLNEIIYTWRENKTENKL